MDRKEWNRAAAAALRAAGHLPTGPVWARVTAYRGLDPVTAVAFALGTEAVTEPLPAMPTPRPGGLDPVDTPVLAISEWVAPYGSLSEAGDFYTQVTVQNAAGEVIASVRSRYGERGITGNPEDREAAAILLLLRHRGYTGVRAAGPSREDRTGGRRVVLLPLRVTNGALWLRGAAADLSASDLHAWTERAGTPYAEAAGERFLQALTAPLLGARR